MADRLAVMDLGRIVQVGRPQELYNRPADVFVARLLGPTNLLQGQVDSTAARPGARWSCGRRSAAWSRRIVRARRRPGDSRHHLDPPRDPLASARPIPPDWNRFPATIERIIFRGDTRQIDLRGPGDWPITVRVLQSQLQGLREGQSLTLSVSPEFVRLLPGKFAVGNGG